MFLLQDCGMSGKEIVILSKRIGGCGCMVVRGVLHDPDQHTLQVRSASRIEERLDGEKKHVTRNRNRSSVVSKTWAK
jgi:hypothetical protein